MKQSEQWAERVQLSQSHDDVCSLPRRCHGGHALQALHQLSSQQRGLA
jgi:hypothetical protein